MTTTAAITTELAQREHEMDAARARIDRARTIESELADLHADIARLAERRDRAAARGKAPLEIPQRPVVVPGIGQVEIAPLLSRETGREIATRFEDKIGELQVEISKRQTQLDALLAE